MDEAPRDIAPESGRHSPSHTTRATYTVGRAAPDIPHEPGRQLPLRHGWLPVICAALLLTACTGDPGSEPVDVKWDRDACARCNMVLSDRRHAAQVRSPAADGRRGQVMKFDDLGCAVLWLDQQAWQAEPGIEIWVTDQHTGQWIDARSAHYTPGKLTPMQYGLGAQADAGPNSLDFASARAHIYAVEQTVNIHGGNLDHPNAARTLPDIPGDPAPSGR